MNPVLVQGLIHHGTVTSPAEFIPRPSGFKGRLRRWGFVALLAGLAGHGLMDVRKKDAPSIRTMGIVAGGTAGIGHRVVHVLLNKGRSVRLVTTEAEGDQVLLQKMIRLSGTMGIVAAQTVLLHRRMLEFHLGQCLPHGLVTGKTEVIPRFEKNELLF